MDFLRLWVVKLNHSIFFNKMVGDLQLPGDLAGQTLETLCDPPLPALV
jgi:hypothetical protein